jgi:hypothetical protein
LFGTLQGFEIKSSASALKIEKRPKYLEYYIFFLDFSKKLTNNQNLFLAEAEFWIFYLKNLIQIRWFFQSGLGFFNSWFGKAAEFPVRDENVAEFAKILN